MISIIAAIGTNNELGKNNDLIWHLPNDLIFFKNITLNHTVIMGYNTYKSIGKALPNRKNIVITSKNIKEDNIDVYHSVEEVISNLKNDEEYFIIGGASIYKTFYPLASKMYLTEINASDKDADVYFPKFDNSDWNRTVLDQREENNIKYEHVLYEKI